MMALDILRIRAICFDVDGTLRDTDDSWVQQVAAGLRPLRRLFKNRDPLPISRRLIMAVENPGNYLLTLLDRGGVDGYLAKAVSLAPGRFARWRTRAHQRGRHTMISGVHEMLHRLHEHYPLAIVTTRQEYKTLEFLDYFDIRPLFSVIATAQSSRYTKPYPDPIFWVAQKLGISADTCLMVGDTTVDIKAGRSAGAQTVGVLCGFGEKEELVRTGADLILPSTADLSAILFADKPFANSLDK